MNESFWYWYLPFSFMFRTVFSPPLGWTWSVAENTNIEGYNRVTNRYCRICLCTKTNLSKHPDTWDAHLPISQYSYFQQQYQCELVVWIFWNNHWLLLQGLWIEPYVRHYRDYWKNFGWSDSEKEQFKEWATVQRLTPCGATINAVPCKLFHYTTLVNPCVKLFNNRKFVKL